MKPDKSDPSVKGGCGLTLLRPSRMIASHGPTPAAATRTSTSPSPGDGSGTSSTTTTSGGPKRWIRTAFTSCNRVRSASPDYHCDPLTQHDDPHRAARRRSGQGSGRIVGKPHLGITSGLPVIRQQLQFAECGLSETIDSFIQVWPVVNELTHSRGLPPRIPDCVGSQSTSAP